jgi:replicative DNA helicase
MFFVDDKPSMDLGYVVAQCRKLKRQHGQLGTVMVDYLGLMETHERRGETKAEATGKITKAFKQLARELDTSIFLLSQMNREIEKRSTKRPVLSDLRDSGSIEQDADMVIFLHKDEEKSDMKMSHIDLIVAKGRNTGVRDFELAFLVEIQRLVTKAVYSPGAR